MEWIDPYDKRTARQIFDALMQSPGDLQTVCSATFVTLDRIASLEIGEKQLNGRLDAAFEIVAALTERVQALEKAAEPKPPAPASPPLLEIDDAYRARDRHVGVASDRIQGILDDPNTRPYAIVMVRCELQAAFAAGVEFARRERNPQTYDNEKILTEPLDGCPWCNHTPEEHRAYRLGYAAGLAGNEPDTCPQIDHPPFCNPWMEGRQLGYAEWEQLNPKHDEMEKN